MDAITLSKNLLMLSDTISTSGKQQKFKRALALQTEFGTGLAKEMVVTKFTYTQYRADIS